MIIEFTPHMGLAESQAELPPALLSKSCVSAIAIDLQYACKISKVDVEPSGFAVCRIEIGDHSRS